jgi:hypothetical protein
MILSIGLFSQVLALSAQENWDAWWVHLPAESKYEKGIYEYRIEFQLNEIPVSKIICVTADMRYELFLNGTKLGSGPVPSSPAYWKYDSYELKSLLEKGANVLSAIVYYDGEERSGAQMSSFSGFCVQEKGVINSAISTPGAWRGRKTKASELEATDWMSQGYDVSGWLIPECQEKAQLRHLPGTFIHGLVAGEANPGYQASMRSSFKSDSDRFNVQFQQVSDELTEMTEASYHGLDPDYIQELRQSRKLGLASMYAFGDDRFYKKLILDFQRSKVPEGLLREKFPSAETSIDPIGSLEWILMLHEYLYYGEDPMFIEQFLGDIEQILQWFESRRDPGSGLIGMLPYTLIVDDSWNAVMETDGGVKAKSTFISLMYSYVLQKSGEIYDVFGVAELANSFRSLAGNINDAVNLYCFNRTNELYRAYPGEELYTEHANLLAVLAGAVDEERKALFVETMLRNKDVVKSSSSFNTYKFEALHISGLGNKLREYSADKAYNTGSYIHTIQSEIGIRSAEIGFSSIIIAPQPGGMGKQEARIMHPSGIIELSLKFDSKGAVSGKLTLPEKLKGIFVWDGQTMELSGGAQRVKILALSDRYKI